MSTRVQAAAILATFSIVLPVFLFFALRWLFLRVLPPLGLLSRPIAGQLATGRNLPPDTSLLQLPNFVPDGFESGLEILNDNTTPMEFVVSTLEKCASMDPKAAIRVMLDIHERGGILLPLDSREYAEGVANAINSEVRTHGHTLICRAVSLN
jgi:ATP-dependent Clp protease adapter protein ClpS